MKRRASSKNAMKVWLDGKIINYKDAKVPILTHSLQYGSGIFEGLRAYRTEKGTAIFRLDDHMKRFMQSAKIYSMGVNYTEKELRKAVVEVVRANKLESCYIRPFIFYNTTNIGVGAFGGATSVFIAALPFGAYYGAGKEKGIRCKISSWRRINSSILPVEAKASGNYINSIIANNEAKSSGFDETILLSIEGHVAEGAAENMFLVRSSSLITPDASADILMGVTRDSIIKIAQSIGLIVQERETHKEELYSADEVFFCGTAAEITPVVNIDGISIGNGRPGPITKLLSDKYTEVVMGKNKEFEDWLTYV
ncbi:branched-chain amino acid transaminase [Candidatus Marsarchaeota archaeon]|jgi:branched-chain amino acid aminotransferase|nr:branched-chain amino acid transaminase [Candidatus Marsarchaeota archaeon]